MTRRDEGVVGAYTVHEAAWLLAHKMQSRSSIISFTLFIQPLPSPTFFHNKDPLDPLLFLLLSHPLLSLSTPVPVSNLHSSILCIDHILSHTMSRGKKQAQDKGKGKGKAKQSVLPHDKAASGHRRVQCPRCEEWMNASSLKRHRQNVHEGAEYEFECAGCTKRFKTSENADAHYLSVQ